MLDIKEIREDAQGVEQRLRRKEPDISLTHIVELDRRVREIKAEAEELQSTRNSASKEIGELKRSGDDATAVMERVQGIGERIEVLNEELRGLEEELHQALAALPNLPGHDATENAVIKIHLDKPTFDFKPKNHLELGTHLFDFPRAAKIAGTGWPAYRGIGARLEFALVQYLFDTQIRNGWEPWLLPHCVRDATMFGSGHLPKFAHQAFKVDEFYLLPTAEAALNGLYSDEILDEADLPLKLCSYTPCFRREAGAAGAHDRGLIRVHQFNKIELFALCTPESSEQLFGDMLASAESVLQGLGLHYRNVELATDDISFASARTVDIEAWLPGQDEYYEVSSVSTCGDFQARRAKIRYRRPGEKPQLVHTLNGSGVATSRLMVALLENNQQADGSVLIPEVLQPYLGVDLLEP